MEVAGIIGAQFRTQHAEDTVHSQKGRVIMCPNCQCNVLASTNRLLKLVWNEKTCSVCVAARGKAASTSADVERFKEELRLMIQHNTKRLEGRIEQLDEEMKIQVAALNKQLEKFKGRLEQNMSPSNAVKIAEQMDGRLGGFRAAIREEVEEQVEATNARVAVLEQGQMETAAVLESLKHNMKDCRERMMEVERDSFSASPAKLAALQTEVDTLKHTVSTILPFYEQLCTKMDEGNVQWGSDVASVQDKVDAIQLEIGAFRLSARDVEKRLDGLEEMKKDLKNVGKAYSNLEERVTALSKRQDHLEKEQAKLKEGQAELRKGQERLEATTKHHAKDITNLKSNVATLLQQGLPSASLTETPTNASEVTDNAASADSSVQSPTEHEHASRRIWRASSSSSSSPAAAASTPPSSRPTDSNKRAPPSSTTARVVSSPSTSSGSKITSSFPSPPTTSSATLANRSLFDGFPNQKSFRLTRTLSGHSSYVSCCTTFQEDGENGKKTWIVSGCHNGTLKAWDATTGICHQTFKGHSDWVLCCTVLDNGRDKKNKKKNNNDIWIISGSLDKTVKIWDWQTGTCLETLKGHSSYVLGCDVLDRNKKYIISGSSDCTVKIWNLETSTCLKTFKASSYIYCCCCYTTSPSWKDNNVGSTYNNDKTKKNKFIIAGCHDGTVLIWNVETGTCLYTLKGHSGGVSCYTVLDKGRSNNNKNKLLVTGSLDNTLKVWDLATGKCLMTLKGHSNSVSCCTGLDQDNNEWVLSGSRDGTLKVWNVATATCQQTLEGHSNWVLGFAAWDGGTKVVSASDDGTLKIWSLS